MSIERISKIKGHRVFKDFVWQTNELNDFKEKNLFYGWNGTGKSTLSNLFRAIEKKTTISEGEIEFIVAGKKVQGSQFCENLDLPQIRVFNENFVAENVFTTSGEVAPIFFLGAENIKKQKYVEKLKNDLKQSETNLEILQKKSLQSKKYIDDFTIDNAKLIKNLLSSPGKNKYNNYNKSYFQTKCDEMLEISDNEKQAKILEETAFNENKTKILAIPLDILPAVEYSFPDTKCLTKTASILLNKTVVSQVIEKLSADQELSIWVNKGLDMHKEKDANVCLFCEQPLPVGRIQELEYHFNDEYNKFLNEIKAQIKKVEEALNTLKIKNLPNRLQVYDHLRYDFDKIYDNLDIEINNLKSYLELLVLCLNKKISDVFTPISFKHILVEGNVNVISELNSIINKHNNETKNFQSTINQARVSIEESIVVSSLMKYKKFLKSFNDADNALRLQQEQISSLKNEIFQIEKEIGEHSKPADELNSDIRSYLGNDDLTFDVMENGYQITRNGILATDLSEGEKTAIAFLYFLKSLSDKSFDLNNGIVVIDDPISSLDSNAIFYAFGFMKERVTDAGQLFILTHSHTFFRLVKNWFNKLPNQRKRNIERQPARFYMLTKNIKYNNRSSQIVKLDSLLHEYDSEYQYLFSLTYEAAMFSSDSGLKQYFHIPNIARRLMEAFLAFRCPLNTGDLYQQLSQVKFDEVKKTRILKFVHTYSHMSHILDPEHDPSILIETREVLQNLLDLIKEEDSQHYEQMVQLVSWNIVKNLCGNSYAELVGMLNSKGIPTPDIICKKIEINEDVVGFLNIGWSKYNVAITEENIKLNDYHIINFNSNSNDKIYNFICKYIK